MNLTASGLSVFGDIIMSYIDACSPISSNVSSSDVNESNSCDGYFDLCGIKKYTRFSVDSVDFDDCMSDNAFLSCSYVVLIPMIVSPYDAIQNVAIITCHRSLMLSTIDAPNIIASINSTARYAPTLLWFLLFMMMITILLNF